LIEFTSRRLSDILVTERTGGGGGAVNELRNRLRLDCEREEGGREGAECLFSRKSKLPARADAIGFLDDAFALASFLSFIFLIRWANKIGPSLRIVKTGLGFIRFEA
jgi:hypothetical protein